MRIETVIDGEMIGQTWGGFRGSMPFSLTHNKGSDLKCELMGVITGDFIRDTVKLRGEVLVTVTKRKGHIYQKSFGLALFPSLATIVIDELDDPCI